MFDSDTLNQPRPKRKRRQQEKRQHHDSMRRANTGIAGELRKAVGADKPTGRVEARGLEQVEEREQGVKPGGTGAVSPKISKSLKLSFRGSVERQAQHRPDRLKKLRTGSVGTDRLGRFCAENRDDARKDIPRGKIFREEYILELV